MPGRATKTRFLVVYDYETGGVWAFVWAHSPEEIHKTFRDLTVIDAVPVWMTADEVSRIERSMTFNVDAVTSDDWIARLLRAQ
jgi:hypothetical protein